MREPITIGDLRGGWISENPFSMGIMDQESQGELKPELAWKFFGKLPNLERANNACVFVRWLNGLPQRMILWYGFNWIGYLINMVKHENVRFITPSAQNKDKKFFVNILIKEETLLVVNRL